MRWVNFQRRVAEILVSLQISEKLHCFDLSPRLSCSLQTYVQYTARSRSSCLRWTEGYSSASAHSHTRYSGSTP